MSHARTALATMILAALTACGGGGTPPADAQQSAEPAKAEEKKAARVEMSPEELAAARKAAGFKSQAEIAAENAAMFEGAAREYVKGRVKDYKKVIGDLTAALGKLEKQAPKWAEAKDPQAAFDKFAEGYKAEVKELTKAYDELTAKGSEGGETQALFGKAFRAWEDLNNDLGAEIAKQERFGPAIAEIRSGFEATAKAVEAIEKDESVKVPEDAAPAPKKKK
jgi:uncharacterized protein YecT (DUF1311 family)